MKKLVLIRHSKSSWVNPFLSDHQRPLATRGLNDAPIMGERLKVKNILPDLIISSDAARAKETALIIGASLGYPKQKIIFTKDLYHASVGQLLSVITSVAPQIETLFLFGHNPGMNEFMWKMKGNLDNLPTTGIFAIKTDIKSWGSFDTTHVDFWFEDYPKKVK